MRNTFLSFRFAYLWSALLAFPVLTALACGADVKKPPLEDDGSSAPTGAGGGSGTAPTTTTDGAAGGLVTLDDGAVVCTALDILGTLVDEQGVNGDFTGAGGTLNDGTFDLVQASVYLGPSGLGGSNGTTLTGSIRINGNAYESALVLNASGAAQSEQRSTGVLTPSGVDATATLALACPAAQTQAVTYSATSGNLTLYFPATRTAYVFRQRS